MSISVSFTRLDLTGLYSIGEESYAAGSRSPLTDDPTYCVDPIGMCSASSTTCSLFFFKRWNDKLCPRFPMGLYLSWSYLQEEACSRSHLQPFHGPHGEFFSLPICTVFIRYPVHRNHRSRLLRFTPRRSSQETSSSQISQAFSHLEPCSDRSVVRLSPLRPIDVTFVVSRGMGE